MINRNRSPQQAAEHAGRTFDDAIAKGFAYVLICGRKATFAREENRIQAELVQRSTPGARILPMRLPVSRIQFIAWVLEPKARKAN